MSAARQQQLDSETIQALYCEHSGALRRFLVGLLRDGSAAEDVLQTTFAKWVERGYRGPGELTIYIEMLAPHLEVPTQQSIFRNLANDCITVVKKTRRPEKPGGFLSRYRFQILLNLLIFALLAGMFYLGRITS